jgi:cell division control protein 7
VAPLPPLASNPPPPVSLFEPINLVERWHQLLELEGQYQIDRQLGTGAFSAVYEATHLPSGKKVAIKRLFPTFSPRKTAAELRVLTQLIGKPHVTQFLDVRRIGDCLSIIMEIQPYQRFQTFFLNATIPLIRSYMHALFSGLQVLHSIPLIHRDIKPSNFLFDPQTMTGVLSDFGLAQTLEQASSLPVSRGGTRGFRPPEVLLGSTHQSTAIDIWAAGLILLSFMTRCYPIFSAAHSDLISLAELGSVFGTAALSGLAAALGQTVSFNYEISPTSLSNFVLILNPAATRFPIEMFELLEKCLQLHPNARITAAQALRHPFFFHALGWRDPLS